MASKGSHIARIVALTLGALLTGAAHAAVNLDLSHVDRTSAAFTRHRAWVDAANATSPPYGFRAADAAYQHRITDGTALWRAHYCQLAVALVEKEVAAAEAAIGAAQRPVIANDSYLEVGPRISDLALAYDWCASVTTAAQRTRWAHYAQQAVWNVWNPSQANWRVTATSAPIAFPWSGWSITNPGNNYHFSFITATLYWALASGSPTWTDFLRTQKIAPLQAYYAELDGGGSREGTGYGTAHRDLFPFYRLWKAATGEDAGNANPHLSDTIRYWAHATVPMRDRFAPFGDQSRDSTATLYDYHRQLVLEARMASTDPTARSIATWWLNSIAIDRMGSAFNYRHDLLPAGSGGTAPTERVYHAAGVGHLFARTSWSTDALWLSFAAGPFEESHAHQDQGAFSLYRNRWLTVTENIGSRSGIQQRTNVQNVLRFERSNTAPLQCANDPANDVVVHQCQPSVSSMTVTHAGADGSVRATADLTAAYTPPRPDIQTRYVQSWIRDIDFDASGLIVHDTFQASAGVTAVFQVNVPVQPVVNGRRATAGELTIDVVEPADAVLTVIDWRSQGSDFASGWRIDVRGSGSEFLVEMGVGGGSLFRDGFGD